MAWRDPANEKAFYMIIGFAMLAAVPLSVLGFTIWALLKIFGNG